MSESLFPSPYDAAGTAHRGQSYVTEWGDGSVQGISLHSASDLHALQAQEHSAQPFLVRDYLD